MANPSQFEPQLPAAGPAGYADLPAVAPPVKGSLAGTEYARYDEFPLTLQEKFFLLLGFWRDERPRASSFARNIIAHPAYEAIITLGMPVVPLILKELDTWLIDDWFPALVRITGENPVPEAHRGNLEAMRECWLEWGETRGYV